MNGSGVAYQDGPGYLLFQDGVAGAQDFVVVSFGEDDVLGLGLGFVNHHARDLVGFSKTTLELFAVFVNVDRFLGYPGFHRCLGYGGGLPHQHAGVKWFRDQIVGTELQPRNSIGAQYRVRHIFLGQVCQGMCRRELHLFVNLCGVHVQGAAEDEREAEHIVHHVGIVGTAGAHDDIGAAGSGVLVSNLRIGIRHGDDNRSGRHRAHHVLRDHATDRESEEHIGAYHRLSQRTQFRVLREALLVWIHARRAALVNYSLGVAQRDVLALHAQPDVVLGSGYRRGSGTVDDQTDFADVLAHHLQSVQQRSPGNNGSAVLVVVEDRDLHRLLQGFFDIETLRGLDVFQIDAAEGGLEQLADFDDFVRIV